MAEQVGSKRSRSTRVTSQRVAAPRAEGAAQEQLERGVRDIEKVIAEVQRGLARAERRIETDARQRLRVLQKEGRAQMRALGAQRRKATRLRGRLSAAAGGSLEDIAKTAQAMVTAARTGAGAVIERFRNVLG
jgi:hypothetical protein